MKGKLPWDVKCISIALIKGYDARRLRFSSTNLEFDAKALKAVEQALFAVGQDIAEPALRADLQKKVFLSIAENIHYRYLGECYCGEKKFYNYRRGFIKAVALEMQLVLDPVPLPHNNKEVS